MNFPIFKYPTLAATDPNILLNSLGSFWNQLFQDTSFLKGYTIAQAEELTQHYLNLLETLKSYSVEDIPIFHTERWLPIVVKRSQFANNQLLFQANDAVFGVQPANDPYYANMIFRFGFPKTSNQKVYALQAPANLIDFSVITPNILSPRRTFIKNVDVILDKGVLFFNKDIFALDDVPKVTLVDDRGNIVTFKSESGQVKQDQLAVLWVYHAHTDQDFLYNNFGYAFDLKLTNNAAYKDILTAVTKLFTNGPTVKAIKALAAAFIGVKPVIHPEEVIEEITTSATDTYIVTDKHVYIFDKYYLKASGVELGKKVFAGDVLVDAVEYFDNIQSRSWWDSKIVPKITYTTLNAGVKTPMLIFPPHLFFGSYQHSFTFKNSIELVTTNSAGDITFPITGDPADVKKFHTHLNLSKDIIKQKLGLINSSAVVINPLDFIFDNFLKYSSALIKFNFKKIEQASTFMAFFHVIKDCLPKHVYFIFYFDFMLDHSQVSTLNNSTTIKLNTQDTVVNSDGTDSTGRLEPETAANYKTDIQTRLFTIAKGVGPGAVFDHIVNSNKVSNTSLLGVEDGGLTTIIEANATTKNVNTLLFLNFSIATHVKSLKGKARVTSKTVKSLVGISRVTSQPVKSLAGKSNVKRTYSSDLTCAAAIKLSAIQTRTGKSNVRRSVTQNLSGLSRVTSQPGRSLAGKAAVKRTNSSDLTCTAAIKLAATKTLSGLSRVTSQPGRSLAGKSAVKRINFSTLVCAAAIKLSVTRSLFGKSAVKRVVTKNLTGKASISGIA